MNRLRNRLPSLMTIVKGRQGQTLVEYSLLLILIAVVAIGAVSFVGSENSKMYCTVATTLP